MWWHYMHLCPYTTSFTDKIYVLLIYILNLKAYTLNPNP